MYYTIREEKVSELKEGKTNVYIAKITNYSRQYLTYIFKGQIKINYEAVTDIIMPLANESMKLNMMIGNHGIDYVINYFFKEENK